MCEKPGFLKLLHKNKKSTSEQMWKKAYLRGLLQLVVWPASHFLFSPLPHRPPFIPLSPDAISRGQQAGCSVVATAWLGQSPRLGKRGRRQSGGLSPRFCCFNLFLPMTCMSHGSRVQPRGHLWDPGEEGRCRMVTQASRRQDSATHPTAPLSLALPCRPRLCRCSAYVGGWLRCLLGTTPGTHCPQREELQAPAPAPCSFRDLGDIFTSF